MLKLVTVAALGALGCALAEPSSLQKSNDMSNTCRDEVQNCALWAGQGECSINPKYMLSKCAMSCNSCFSQSSETGDQSCSDDTRAAEEPPARPPISPFNPPSPSQQCADDLDSQCDERAALGHCDSQKGEMLMRCPRACGVCPYWGSMKKVYDCADTHENCRFWAAAGECENNPAYMVDNCAVSCEMCDKKLSACDRPEETPPLLRPGDINATFMRLLRDFPQYSPKIVSRPGAGKFGDASPWLVTMSNFVSDEEADAFIGSCQGHFNRSLAGDHVSPVRTSNQCWCEGNECERSALTRRVSDRISAITGAPSRYMEPFQVLKYEVGQFYKTHHDQNSAVFTPQGPRVFTFYMYLSTPEAGGGTRFNDLGVTVPAVKGNAVLWPSVMDADPDRDEPYTRHESIPVEHGTKYGANIWVHNYDYRTPSAKGCPLSHMCTTA
mmetsp:Transcript_32855/g.63249  ORF Transcript_32855/g.63249 Transcript_32855/m.63249 type:complete len:440 (+) Transcript_32855:238-1557(+)